jgi:3-hydroxyisobutyrate dehydrogenase
MRETVGFIGLGIMGSGMSRNLVEAGFGLTVWNRTASKAEEFAAEVADRGAEVADRGAEVAASPADLASKVDIVVICVSDTPDVEEVILGEAGVLHGVSEGALVVDCSTISPIRTREIAKALAEKGASMLDAPVSGGSEGAAEGTLSIMVGGDAGAFERARPVLEAMGQTITHVGPSGAGQMVKLVNQILVVGGMLAMSEALLFAEAGGLDLEKTLAAVSGGAAGSWTLSNRGPQVIRRDWRPGFMIDLQQKDVKLILEAASQLKVPLMATSIVHHLYGALQKRGCGREGNHALVKALEQLSGVKVGVEVGSGPG